MFEQMTLPRKIDLKVFYDGDLYKLVDPLLYFLGLLCPMMDTNANFVIFFLELRSSLFVTLREVLFHAI